MKTIDGIKLKEAFISGANNLYNHYPEVDALNVFPVPDGDTGMNMNLTLTCGCKEIENKTDKDVDKIAKAFASGLISGCRGNSGVITAFIFQGFSKALKGETIIDALILSKAFEGGVSRAYKGINTPVEGTILTVIREASRALKEQVKESFSIEKCFEILINEAHLSLSRTPELLPVLKEAGVVDSGGCGLCFILEGMLSALKGKLIERKLATAISSVADEESEYVYNVSVILNTNIKDKKPVIDNRLIEHLRNRGLDPIEILHIDDEKIQIKMKSTTPGRVINFVQQYGEFLNIEIKNPKQSETYDFVSEKDINKNLPKSKYAIISVSAGDGITKFFKELGVNQIVYGGQTMNPSCEDFIDAINRCHAENVIILPNNSNIILAADQAASLIKGVHVEVLKTKSILQGISACIMFDEQMDLNDNLEQMNEAISNVKSGSVTHAIRDSEMDGLKIKENDFIGILDKKIVSTHRHEYNTVMELISKMVDEESAVITILIGKDADSALVEKIKAKVESKYPDLDIDIREGLQPVYSFLIGVE